MPALSNPLLWSPAKWDAHAFLLAQLTVLHGCLHRAISCGFQPDGLRMPLCLFTYMPARSHASLPAHTPLPVLHIAACSRASLPVHIHACPLTCLSAYYYACLPAHMPLCLLTCLSACYYACLPAHMPLCLLSSCIALSAVAGWP